MKKLILMLPVAYFGLMCLGLLLASYFLQVDKLTGSEWVAMCGVLFGAVGYNIRNAVPKGVAP